mmetsp:Transcript_76803/g.207421  ORF Transcript_76803/g.207421 Transcript_76803/m.207421 type:complete len:136 (+) Transcript_76803:448-855(+)
MFSIVSGMTATRGVGLNINRHCDIFSGSPSVLFGRLVFCCRSVGININRHCDMILSNWLAICCRAGSIDVNRHFDVRCRMSSILVTSCRAAFLVASEERQTLLRIGFTVGLPARTLVCVAGAAAAASQARPAAVE